MSFRVHFFGNTVSIVKVVDSSSERDTLQAINNQKLKVAKIDSDTTVIGPELNAFEPLNLSGLDIDGNESRFTASLSFETPLESVFLFSDLLFSDLNGNTIDDWLLAVFNDFSSQLPMMYQPNLSLDLADNEISFLFPGDTKPGSGSVSNNTNDTNGAASLSVEAQKVPESSTILSLLALGILCISLSFKRY